MNERIKELAEQAMSATFNKFSGVEWSAEEWRNFYDTKFAELIVRECMAQCANNGSSDEWDKGVRWAAEQIREHFGVEE
jgi:hypothetical protein